MNIRVAIYVDGALSITSEAHVGNVTPAAFPSNWSTAKRHESAMQNLEHTLEIAAQAVSKTIEINCGRER